MNDHEQESTLKVSDRRHFTYEGERRAGVPDSAPPPPPAAAPPPPAPATAPAAPRPAEPAGATAPPPPPVHERLAEREIHFAGLLQDLYATAMMQLGAEMQPGQPGQLDLEGARETIDLLGMLRQKTRGNLSPQEEQLFSAILSDLQLAYVQVRNANARIATPPPLASMPRGR